jgi:hypothetical protein
MFSSQLKSLVKGTVTSLESKAALVPNLSITTFLNQPSCETGYITEPVFVNLLRTSGFDSLPIGTVRQPYLTYRPVRQHRLAESIPCILGSLNVYKFGHRRPLYFFPSILYAHTFFSSLSQGALL